MKVWGKNSDRLPTGNTHLRIVSDGKPVEEPFNYTLDIESMEEYLRQKYGVKVVGRSDQKVCRSV